MKKLLIAMVFCLPMMASAAVDGYVGLGIGIADIDLESGSSESYDPSSSGAFRIGMIIDDTFGIGLTGSSYSADLSGADLRLTAALIEFNYFLMGRAGFYFGAAVGQMRETIEGTVLGLPVTISEDETAYGLQLGYNFVIAESHTLGGEARFVSVDGDPEGYNFMSLHFTWNYWF